MSQSSDHAHWYVAHTQARGEAKAQINLEHQGFQTYLPRFLKERRHARRVDNIAVPLFQRYIFIHMDTAKMRWRAIQSTYGIQNLVCHGDTPAPLGDNVILEIRKRENDTGFIQLDATKGLKKGDAVRVSTGPFTNLEGLFDSYSDASRVTVLLNMLGGSVPVKLPKSHIHPTS